MSCLICVVSEDNALCLYAIENGNNAHFLPRFASRKSTCFRTVALSAIIPSSLRIASNASSAKSLLTQSRGILVGTGAVCCANVLEGDGGSFVPMGSYLSMLNG